MGTVSIGGRIFELPDEQPRELGAACAYLQRKGPGWVAPTPDVLIAVNAATQIEIDVVGGFADFPTPAEILAGANRPRQIRL